MFRFIILIILIGISASGFFFFVNPLHKEVISLQTKIDSYNKALDNSRALENERDKLTKKLNSIDALNLDKLTKLLPDNVDNIRLIIEIGEIASPYKMILKDVKYSVGMKEKAGEVADTEKNKNINLDNKNYGVLDLEFSVEGTYEDFLNFVRDLENNLRIVDIISIEFSSASLQNQKSEIESYKYTFKIRTYWLKN